MLPGDKPGKGPEEGPKMPSGPEKAKEMPTKPGEYKEKAAELTRGAREALETPEEKMINRAADKYLNNSDYKYSAAERAAILKFLPRGSAEEKEIGSYEGQKRTVSWNENGEFVVNVYGEAAKMTYPQRV